MKLIFTLITTILLAASIFAQAPEKMSYQAVIRNSSEELVINTQIEMQISILQGWESGIAVYVETQTPTTNANGLVSIEIGEGTTSYDFSNIDWANGPYFIKTETDPTGGSIYTITGTSQFMSVPYALHAKTAENVTGNINEIDPIYTASEAANITNLDILNLSNLSGNNTGDQDISGIATNTTAISDEVTRATAAEGTNENGIAALELEQTTQNTAIAINTAKAGITEEQATIIANTSGINTGDQDISGIATNTTAISDEVTRATAAEGVIQADVDANQTASEAAAATLTTNIAAINTLADGNVYLGNASNQATEVTLTGDVTIDNAGVSTIGASKVVTGMIADGTILVGDLATDAVETAKIKDANVTTAKIADANVTNTKLDKTNIPLSGFGVATADVALGAKKLTGVADPTLAQDAATKKYVDDATTAINTLTDGTVYLGDGTNTAQEVTLTGDVTIDNAGVSTIGVDKIITTKIKDNNVTYAKIQSVTTDKVLGRISSGTGNVEEIGTTGTGDVVRANSPVLTGTVTANSISATTLSAANILGTLLTGSQPMITTVGTLTALNVSGTSTLTGNTTVGGTLGVTGVTTLSAQPILSTLTASLPVFSDGNKGLVSNTITGSGSVVMSASPTFTGTPTLPTGTIATTQTAGNNSTAIATTAYVDAATTAINTLADGTVYLGDGSNIAQEVTLTGDVTIDNAGVSTIGADKVVTAKILDANVTTAKIADANITDGKIATGIDAVKLADGSVTNTELQYINSLSSNAQTQIDAKTTDIATNVTAIALNTAKVTNVSTDLTITGTTGARVIVSSDGTDATIPVATTEVSGVMSKATYDEHVVNNNKTGITSGQASEIATNTAKISYTDAAAVALNTAKNTNVSTNLTITGTTGARVIVSSDGTDATIPVATTAVSGVMSKAIFDAHVVNNDKTGITSAQAGAITANTAKITNVSTNLTITGTTGARVIVSSDGTDATIPVATAAVSGVMSKATYDEHVVNNDKTGITAAQATTLSNTSGTNTGDQTVITAAQASAIATNTTDIATNVTIIISVIDNLIKGNTTDIATNVTAIGLNTAKNTNVSTNLTIAASTGARVIVSSDGTDATIPIATTSESGVMSKAIFDAHVLNNNKTGITSDQANAITANTAKTSTYLYSEIFKEGSTTPTTHTLTKAIIPAANSNVNFKVTLNGDIVLAANVTYNSTNNTITLTGVPVNQYDELSVTYAINQ